MVEKKLKILFAASECFPFVKVGGLGDVVGSLTKALAEFGLEIRIFLPKYEIVNSKDWKLKNLFTFQLNGERVKVLSGKLGEKVLVYFFENEKYLSKNGVYFVSEDFRGFERFLFFSKAIFEFLEKTKLEFNIIHCHDWHTAILPLFFSLKKISKKSILTIHNLDVQGKWEATEVFNFLKLKGNEVESLKIRDKDGDFNILQQGILNATLVTTVSPTYSEEIQSKKFGRGLEKWLRIKKPIGILNGIDTEFFNPLTDPYLKSNYSFPEIEKKLENKIELQRIVGFEKSPDYLLAGFIGRLSHQKGIELFEKIIDKLVKEKIQIIFLGVGEKRYEELLIRFAKKYPKNISAQIKFDLALAQKIYGGCDIILIPSLFEPCGLVQMIAQRYGTIPVARKTGGLSDTIEDGKTGFLFEKYTSFAFLEAIKRAKRSFKNKRLWKKIIKNAMRKDFSWKKSAKKYLKLYKSLIKKS